MEFLSQQNGQLSSSSQKKVIIVFSLLALAFALRFLYIFILHPPEHYIFSDMGGYYDRAFNMGHHLPKSISDTLTAPGAHYFYSVCFYFSNPFLAIKLMNLAVSMLSCYFIYLIALELFGLFAAYIALFISAVNYLFIDYAGYILSETPFLFFFSLLFYLIIKSTKASGVRRKSAYLFCAGIVSSMALAIRPGILIFLVLFVLWSLINWRKQKFVPIVFFVIGYMPIYFLIIFQTYHLTGEWGFVSKNGGLNFYQGRTHVRDVNFDDAPRGAHFKFASPVAIQKGYSKDVTFNFGPYESQKLIDEAMKEVKKDIPRTIVYSLEHVLDLFHTTTPWPSCCQDDPNEVIVKYFNIIFIYLIIVPSIIPLVWRFRRIFFSDALLLYLALGSNIAVVMVYYGDPRFRVPFDMFSIILTAFLISSILRKSQSRGIEGVI